MTVLRRSWRLVRRFRADNRGLAFLEFALILPLFVGFIVAGLEITQLILANMKVQRIATMAADMIAQRGASDARLSEMQIYDIMSALEIAAKPLHTKQRGRLIMTAVVGEDTNKDNVADVNRIKWQRFDGGRTTTVPILGCWKTSTQTPMAPVRQLTLNEPVFHVQVTYDYEPMFGAGVVKMFAVPTTITRVAAYRGRGAIYQPVMASDGYTAKDDCAAA